MWTMTRLEASVLGSTYGESPMVACSRGNCGKTPAILLDSRLGPYGAGMASQLIADQLTDSPA